MAKPNLAVEFDKAYQAVKAYAEIADTTPFDVLNSIEANLWIEKDQELKDGKLIDRVEDKGMGL